MDENVVLEIYDECNRVEKLWREELKKNAQEAQQVNQASEEKKEAPTQS